MTSSLIQFCSLCVLVICAPNTLQVSAFSAQHLSQNNSYVNAFDVRRRNNINRNSEIRKIRTTSYTRYKAPLIGGTVPSTSPNKIFAKKDEECDNNVHNENNNIIFERIKNSNLLDIRLDATLASVYNLCRFLIFDLSTGAKQVPGWQISDFIMLGGAFSSCIVLSILWTIVGVYITDLFGIDEEERKRGDSFFSGDVKIAFTAFIVGPLWQFVEIICGWPPSGVTLSNVLGQNNLSIASLTTVVSASVGLMSIMYMGKLLTSGLRS